MSAPVIDMDTVDLDIANYGLDDLLHLFQLDAHFDATGLAKAKRVVLRMHPDKSRKDPKFFLFYSKAYKVLFQLWEYRNVGGEGGLKRPDEEMEYSPDIVDDVEKRALLDKMFGTSGKNKNKKVEQTKTQVDFNVWFNTEFEKMRVGTNGTSDADEDAGYGNWLKSDEGCLYSDADGATGATSTSQMMTDFSVMKTKMCSDLVAHHTVGAYDGGNFGDNILTAETRSNGMYDGAGGGLAYQDLKQAFTETLIPVDDQNPGKYRQSFSSVNEMQCHRNGHDMTPMGKAESHRMLQSEKEREDADATRLAFRLAKESDEVGRNTQQFWGRMQRLKDNTTK